MTASSEAVPAVARHRAPSAGRAARSTARGLGELLMTVGLVLLLFVAYQLVWTNVEAQRAQGQVSDQLRDQWERPTGTTAVAPAVVERDDVRKGKGFAFLHIPRLGKDYSVPVLEGVGLGVLARGVGHYPQTALPGEIGNVGIAGHRATNGEPFAYLDRLRPGDALILETDRHWLTYVVDSSKIVLPTDVWVLDPVPGQPDAEPTEQLITLTTCNPRWGSTERLIVFGHLENQRLKTAGPPPELGRKA